MINIDNPGKIADFITSILNIEKKDQQDILETLDVRERMEKFLFISTERKSYLGFKKKSRLRSMKKSKKASENTFFGKSSRLSNKNLEWPRMREVLTISASEKRSIHFSLKARSRK